MSGPVFIAFGQINWLIDWLIDWMQRGKNWWEGHKILHSSGCVWCDRLCITVLHLQYSDQHFRKVVCLFVYMVTWVLGQACQFADRLIKVHNWWLFDWMSCANGAAFFPATVSVDLRPASELCLYLPSYLVDTSAVWNVASSCYSKHYCQVISDIRPLLKAFELFLAAADCWFFSFANAK